MTAIWQIVKRQRSFDRFHFWLGMLVAQGVIGIEYWTGETPDAAVMRAGLEAVFGD